ncbi:MAG: hypothetical protein ABIH23_31120 [bacterium]
MASPPKNEIVVSIATLDKIAEEYSVAACMGASGRFKQMMLISSGIKRLRNALTPEILQEVMFLQGSALGFLTDKDKEGGYKDLNVIRDCVLEATMRGAMVCGNEMNIIARRPYFTKAYFERILRQFPGLTGLKVNLSVPKLVEGRQVVHASCSWALQGVKDSLEVDIPIKVNAGMGDDAILGKARRKALAQIYGQITGSPLADADVDDAVLKPANIVDDPEPKDPPPPATKTAALKNKLKARALPKPEPEPAEEPEPEEEDLTPPEEDVPEDPYHVVGKITAVDADPDGDFFCLTVGRDKDCLTKDPDVVDYATDAFDNQALVEVFLRDPATGEGNKLIIEEIKTVEE